jgi:multidrug efflux pump subunit AcrB
LSPPCAPRTCRSPAASAEPPIADRAFQPNLVFTGRLTDPGAFERIVVKAGADGRIVRLKDIARIELGALSYSTNSFLMRKPAVALALALRPGSNALATQDAIQKSMAEMKKDFPKGLEYNLAYNPTEFIAESVKELVKTIYEAVALVVVVVIVFLQRWRAAIIPVAAIPVSLVGTFAVMSALGFSINNLTLFGLVLAVGIVVDDAIVVVENVERHLSRAKARSRPRSIRWPRSAARGCRSRWCCRPCSSRPPSCRTSQANSSSSSRSPLPRQR